MSLPPIGVDMLFPHSLARPVFCTALFLTSALPVIVSAQQPATASVAPSVPVAFQIRGGLNLAHTSYDPDPPSEIETPMGFGPSIGVLMDFGGPKNPHFLIGATIDSRPSKLEDESDKLTLKAVYLTIPVMLSFKSPVVQGSPRMFLNLGAEPAFNISKNVEYNGEDAGDGEVEAFDFALRAEGGFAIPINANSAFLLGIGYTHSLTNYLGASDQTGVDGYHRVIRIFAGLSFGGV